MPGITNPTEEYFKDGTWGWDGTRWRKANIFLNYYDRYADYISDVDVTAGNHDENMTAVPAGYVYVVLAVSAYCSTATPTLILLKVMMGAIDISIKLGSPVVEWVPVIFTGQLVLKAGDYICGRFLGCGLHDDLYLRACGYKVAIS